MQQAGQIYRCSELERRRMLRTGQREGSLVGIAPRTRIRRAQCSLDASLQAVQLWLVHPLIGVDHDLFRLAQRFGGLDARARLRGDIPHTSGGSTGGEKDRGSRLSGERVFHFARPRSRSPSVNVIHPRTGSDQSSSCAIPRWLAQATSSPWTALRPRRIAAHLKHQYREQQRKGERLRMSERACLLGRAAQPFDGFVRSPEQPGGSCRFAAAEESRLDADVPRACAMDGRIMKLERLHEVLMRRDQLAEMVVGGTEAPLRHHDQIRIADPCGDRVQLLGEIEARADFARGDVVCRKAHEHRDDL